MSQGEVRFDGRVILITEAVAASLAAFGRIDGILHNASTAPNIATADALSSGRT